MLVRNTDARPGAYDEMREKFRPSHADFTYQAKFGFRDHRGGGRSSARETVGRVAAGAVAKKILGLAGGVEIRAYVDAGPYDQHAARGLRGRFRPWPRSMRLPSAARTRRRPPP